MADATTIKGGKVRIMLGSGSGPITYAAPCGFNSKTVTLNKALEDSPGVSCDNPDAVQWLLRDAVSLSMTVQGEGVLATESVQTWTDAFLDVDSVPAKVEIEMPDGILAFTGNMHVENIEWGAPDGRRVTASITMQSDGEMADTFTAGAP